MARRGVRAQKATFALDPSLLEALDRAVAAGGAPSKNAMVERALRAELGSLQRAARRRRWEQAAKDPLLLRDVEEAKSDFEAADIESARRIG